MTKRKTKTAAVWESFPEEDEEDEEVFVASTAGAAAALLGGVQLLNL